MSGDGGGSGPGNVGAAGGPWVCRLEPATWRTARPSTGLVGAMGRMFWGAVPKSFLFVANQSWGNVPALKVPLDGSSHPQGARPGCRPPCATAELPLNRLLAGEGLRRAELFVNAAGLESGRVNTDE